MTADTAMDHHPMPGANMNGSAPSHSTCASLEVLGLHRVADEMFMDGELFTVKGFIRAACG